MRNGRRIVGSYFGAATARRPPHRLTGTATLGSVPSQATDLTARGRRELRAALLGWFDRQGRDLVFRSASDPWSVLVSEVMLQQTQAARVGPAWSAFMARFPTPAALADSTGGEALRAWAGLGYHRRAVNLQRAATIIVQRHGGAVPSQLEDLIGLPGIGPYSARAVAAIAFGQPVAAVDTNVRRVVGRVVGGTGHRLDGPGAMPPPVLQEAADRLVDRGRAADWTHAVMDVGAMLCTPRRPRCTACPLRPHCLFAANSARRVPPVVPQPRADPRPPFSATGRWLRGRIVGRLREARRRAWVALDAPIGEHPTERVAAALVALEREGLVERHPDGRVRLPSSRS